MLSTLAENSIAFICLSTNILREMQALAQPDCCTPRCPPLPISALTGLAFKGTIAGDSVPATSSAFGDLYVISSPGTSQSKDWNTGDQAIYLGTSGAWDQVSIAFPFGAGLPVYADNVAAITGGLAVGAFYRTGDDPDPVCVVH